MSADGAQDRLVDHYQRTLAPQVEGFVRSVADTLTAHRDPQADQTADHMARQGPRLAPSQVGRALRSDRGARPALLPHANEYVPDLGGVRVPSTNATTCARSARLSRSSARAAGGCRCRARSSYGTVPRGTCASCRDPYVEIKDSPRGSYRSRHFMVREAVGTQIRCEIQLRTVLEEAVFEAHHRLVYRVRQEHRDPCPEAEQVLGALTEMLTVADSLLSDCYRWSREQ